MLLIETTGRSAVENGPAASCIAGEQEEGERRHPERVPRNQTISVHVLNGQQGDRNRDQRDQHTNGRAQSDTPSVMLDVEDILKGESPLESKRGRHVVKQPNVLPLSGRRHAAAIRSKRTGSCPRADPAAGRFHRPRCSASRTTNISATAKTARAAITNQTIRRPPIARSDDRPTG